MRGGVAEPGAQGEEQRQRPARGHSGPGAQLHGASPSSPSPSVRLSARPAALPAPSLTQIPPTLFPPSAVAPRPSGPGAAPSTPARSDPAGPARRPPPAVPLSPAEGERGSAEPEGWTPAPRGAGRRQRGPRSPFPTGSPEDGLGEGPRGDSCPGTLGAGLQFEWGKRRRGKLAVRTWEVWGSASMRGPAVLLEVTVVMPRAVLCAAQWLIQTGPVQVPSPCHLPMP